MYHDRNYKTYAPGTYQTASHYPDLPPSPCEWLAREIKVTQDKKCGKDLSCRERSRDEALDTIAKCMNMNLSGTRVEDVSALGAVHPLYLL